VKENKKRGEDIDVMLQIPTNNDWGRGQDRATIVFIDNEQNIEACLTLFDDKSEDDGCVLTCEIRGSDDESITAQSGRVACAGASHSTNLESFTFHKPPSA
jgi:hypothetical protein